MKTDPSPKESVAPEWLSKSASYITLSALSFSLLTGCDSKAEVSSLAEARSKFGLNSASQVEVVQQNRKLIAHNPEHQKTLDLCLTLRDNVDAYSRLLDRSESQDNLIDLSAEFATSLLTANKELLEHITKQSFPSEDRRALEEAREQTYTVYRTHGAGRLTALKGGSGNRSSVDGNSEMLYSLIAKLDTVITRLKIYEVEK